jgi:hypothetical protein
MQKLTSFFWYCSGAELSLLKKSNTETSRYVGIGATIFFTGLFAALAAAYALYTVFDNAFIASLLGLIWGLMIFNLDRYIVSSMRKEGKFGRELLLATPRIVLAIIISIVIAKPLELKIFDKEIQAELVVMEQQKYKEQETQLRERYTPAITNRQNELARLKAEVEVKLQQRNVLMQKAQEEADGTGGSKKRNLGPIYKIKKADADKADQELIQLTERNQKQISTIEDEILKQQLLMDADENNLVRSKLNGPASRMEALSRLAGQSDAILWAHWFIILLFIAIETAPLFVKLISSKGPYDNLLKVEEHTFATTEIEALAKTNAAVKERNAALAQHERSYITDRLDASLK